MGLTYQIGRWTSWTIAKFCFRFRAYHTERIPKTGPVILAMNHQSYLDPPMAGLCCPQREIYYLARKTLLQWPILGPLFPRVNVIPVDQDRADMSALKTVIKMVRAGEGTVIFPEGSRCMDGHLLPALPGLGLVIAKTRAPVIPMRIFGAHEAFPRGGKKLRFHPITITVGQPMTFTDEDFAGPPREVYQRLSDRVMEQIAALRNEREG
jgi:1-acyl-sn-glycerol-3-phosphate acyltransferase